MGCECVRKILYATGEEEKRKKYIKADEELELMRDHCENERDLAIIDMLASTGMRVGEMAQLNIDDINFNERECVVLQNIFRRIQK